MHYTEAALEAAVRLSAQYINERFLPDKAIDVIDEAGAYMRMKHFREAPEQAETLEERPDGPEQAGGETGGDR